MLKDRTNEFYAIVESIHNRQPGLDHARLLSNNQTQKLSKSEFARAASAVGREISSTASKLSRLAALAKKKSLFDDRPQEINELIHVIKQDIGRVSGQISGLQKYLDSAKKGGGSVSLSHTMNGGMPANVLGASNKQVEEHSDLVIKSLQSRLATTSHEFKGILEIRSQNMVEQKERRAQFTSNSGTSMPTVAPNTTGLLDSALYSSNRASQDLRQRPSSGVQNSSSTKDSDIVIDFSSLPPINSNTQQSQMLLSTNGTQEYIESRSQAIESIESTIAELGQIYQSFATILAGQREMVQRIDDNVQDVEMNVEGAHGQLIKYYQSISSNRWLMIRVFAVLVVFFMVFIMMS